MSPEDHVGALIDQLRFPADPEMSDTPRRVVEWLSTFVPGERPTVSRCASASTHPVVMRDIPFHSLCAHHLLPFFGTATVAYRPAGTICGLGSLSRAVAHFARQPQVQERLGEQIAHHLFEALQPSSLVVRLEARQLCVELTQGIQPTIVSLATLGDDDPVLLSQLDRR